MSRREYHDSALIVQDGPFRNGDLIRAEGALCVDGVRRTAHASHDGVADTFFSIPAFVYVQHRRVYGYVTVETMNGFTTEMPDDPATVKFHAYLYRKNHALIVDPDAHAFEGDIGPCNVCGGARRAAIHAVDERSRRER